MPDPLELPRVLGAVVPLVRTGSSIIDKFISDWLPRCTTAVGALDQLPKPPGGLRRIQPIWVSRGSLEMVNLPAGKMRTADLPVRAVAVRGQDERTFACTNQDPYVAHCIFLSAF